MSTNAILTFIFRDYLFLHCFLELEPPNTTAKVSQSIREFWRGGLREKEGKQKCVFRKVVSTVESLSHGAFSSAVFVWFALLPLCFWLLSSIGRVFLSIRDTTLLQTDFSCLKRHAQPATVVVCSDMSRSEVNMPLDLPQVPVLYSPEFRAVNVAEITCISSKYFWTLICWTLGESYCFTC